MALGVSRAVLAAGLCIAELYPFWWPLTVVSVAYLIYLAYSIFALWWQRADDGRADLLRLTIDLLLLLLVVATQPDRDGWFAGLAFLFVLLSASLYHTLREIAMVVGMGIAFAVFTQKDQAAPLAPLVLVAGGLAVVLGVQRRIVEQRLSHTMKQTVWYRSEAENARELERQRIAADLHDGPLQSFISFQMRLEVIKKLLNRDKDAAVADMVQLQEICRKQITDMRSFVRSMRMSQDGATPATSIRQIADDFQKTSGIPLNWNSGDALSGLEPEISHEVLQIIREALHNVVKHSRATKVALSAEKKENSLYVQVEDDGSGFPFGGVYNLEELEMMRMGPESIKRRVRSLNGDLAIESNPGRGAMIKIRVPL